jgi:hypothetical protein
MFSGALRGKNRLKFISGKKGEKMEYKRPSMAIRSSRLRIAV